MPVMAGELVELVGNTGAASSLQTSGMAAKVGIINGFTVTVNVVISAH